MPATHGADEQRTGDTAIAEAKLAALEVLTYVPHWHLADERWTRVTEIVQSIDKALSAGDLMALAAATIELELAGPVRITRVGATTPVPAPPQVRQRVNRLVHSLTRDAETDRGEGERGKDSGHDQPPNQR